MSDNEDLASYGTPLTSLDEDNYHQRKAQRLEDQVVTDKQGRRRFHGAFTGGFSAGYYNTVDTKEGWTPSTFVSSRNKRAEKSSGYTATDFMDEDDLGEHGIAPQRLQITSSYDSAEANKRKRKEDPEQPIPGVAVLHDFLTPIRETIGTNVLKKFGWKSGQGIGPRITRKEKQQTDQHVRKMYGCELPNDAPNSDESDDDFTNEKGFAPDDHELALFSKTKTNKFGLGYKPLAQTNILSNNIDTYGSSLTLKEKNKRVNIRGQAFGVGAFENDDEDIYGKEDMTSYDFSLDDPSESIPKKTQLAVKGITNELEGFSISKKPWKPVKAPELPKLPKDFKPVHTPRKIRFEMTESARRGLGRHDLSVEDRQRIISNEPSNIPGKAEVSTEDEKIITELLSNLKPERGSTFKPYERDLEKQRRYELYSKMKDKKMTNRFHLVQPRKMTEWEKDQERREFENTSNLYQPVSDAISSRFTTGSHLEETTLKHGLTMPSEIPSVLPKTKEKVDDMKQAAETKMYGMLTQEKVEWHPDSLLCKRFFVTNPYEDSSIVGVPETQTKKTSVFEHLKETKTEVPDGKESPQLLTNTQDPFPPISEVAEDKPEDYGLKVPIDGLPTIDLFKAIFEDSDDDDDDEVSENISRTPVAQETQKLLSNSIETSVEPREIPKQATFPHLVKSAKASEKRETLTGRKPAGIFSNIDFEELNAYRHTSRAPEQAEKSASDSDEYGPSPPPSASVNCPRILPTLKADNEGLWVEKQSLEKAKKHKKKHKKDKKHKKSNKKSR